MKPKNSSVDLFAVKRDREMTPSERLDWLAAAWEFANMKKEIRTNKSVGEKYGSR